MTTVFTTKTNFTAGELSHDLLGRVDLSSYANGAMTLKNVFIQPTGGVTRRAGTSFVADIGQTGRLIVYEKSISESYLMVLQGQKIDVFMNDNCVASVTSPWTVEQIHSVRWCQGADGLYLVHPDVQPQKLVVSENEWILKPFSFLVEKECILQPYHKFCADDVTVSVSANSGNITITASADVFLDKHVDKLFKIGAGYALITQVDSPTVAKAVVKKPFTDDEENTELDNIRSWGEPAFDDDYGWPITVAFYQSRLVFGGSRSLPNNLWFSQSNELTNFELGDAYDSDAIDFSLLSDQNNSICALFSGRHLQVFTGSSEWMVSGDPLTPVNIQLKRQTQVGSVGDRYVPPIGIDGATIFSSANGCEIREFLFADIEQAYQATDLSLLSAHLINSPVDQSYDKVNRQAYVIMADGSLCVLTSFRSENLQSWTKQETAGQFVSVAVVGQKTYFLIRRNDSYYLERLDKGRHTDCSYLLSAETAQLNFTGLTALEGQTVKIVADGVIVSDQVVQNGGIVLDYPAVQVEVGLGFTHCVEPLPVAVGANNGAAPVSSARLIKAVFRVIDTASLEVDTGTGLHQELITSLSKSYLLNQVTSPRTADIVVRSLGWVRSPTQPLWQIKGDTPKPFQLVSVTSDIQLGG